MTTDVNTGELRLEPWAIRVEAILDWQGRTRAWLAGKLEIDAGHFHRILHGQRGFKLYPHHKKAIAQFLEVPPGVIFDEGMAGVLLRLSEVHQMLVRMEAAMDQDVSDSTVKTHREKIRQFLAAYKMEVEEQKRELGSEETKRLASVAEEVGGRGD